MARALLNHDGEVVVELANGWTLRSGVYDQDAADALTSGEYVRLCRPDGEESSYWDRDEWATDPAVVMGAIVNSAAGLHLESYGRVEHPTGRTVNGSGDVAGDDTVRRVYELEDGIVEVKLTDEGVIIDAFADDEHLGTHAMMAADWFERLS